MGSRAWATGDDMPSVCDGVRNAPLVVSENRFESSKAQLNPLPEIRNLSAV